MLNKIPSVLIAVVLVTGLAGCQQEQSAPLQMSPPQVEVSPPIAATITEWDEYTGRFEAVSQVDVRARVSGYLDAIRFRDGQMVNKGDVLFMIDPRPFEIALNSAKSRFDLAKKELDRGRDLRSKNSISQEEVDRRVSEYELATAALDSAKLDLEFTQVKAPISGLVSRDLVNQGNLVNGSANNATLLTTIVSINPIHFYFEAGERDLLKYLRQSQRNQRESSRDHANPVKVRLQDEEEFVHEGQMDFVDNRIDLSTGTIQGRAIFNNPEGLFLPGMFGRMRLQGRADIPAMLLPDASIGTDQARKFVYVVDENNQVGRRFITLGSLHTPELRVIESGLNAQDRVVVKGLMRVRPGATVTPETVDLASRFEW